MLFAGLNFFYKTRRFAQQTLNLTNTKTNRQLSFTLKVCPQMPDESAVNGNDRFFFFFFFFNDAGGKETEAGCSRTTRQTGEV